MRFADAGLLVPTSDNPRFVARPEFILTCAGQIGFFAMDGRTTQLVELAERIKDCEAAADALGLDTVGFLMAMALKEIEALQARTVGWRICRAVGVA